MQHYDFGTVDDITSRAIDDGKFFGGVVFDCVGVVHLLIILNRRLRWSQRWGECFCGDVLVLSHRGVPVFERDVGNLSVCWTTTVVSHVRATTVSACRSFSRVFLHFHICAFHESR